jgi:3'(2'), 5'-bisphosphate nucleotidase
MALSDDDLARLIPDVLSAAREIGIRVLKERADGLKLRTKLDDTIVSHADIISDEFWQEKLAALTPNAPVVSEESFSTLHAKKIPENYWCIDPIDSTDNFTRGGRDFSINIAFIREAFPVFGAIHFPARNLTYIASEKTGAVKYAGENAAQKIHTRPTPPEGLHIVVSSNSHGKAERLEPYTGALPLAFVRRLDGAQKFCLVAEGSADLYPRFTRISEWDIAAGHAIIKFAGGMVTNLEGQELSYGKSMDFECDEFIAYGKKI